MRYQLAFFFFFLAPIAKPLPTPNSFVDSIMAVSDSMSEPPAQLEYLYRQAIKLFNQDLSVALRLTDAIYMEAIQDGHYELLVRALSLKGGIYAQLGMQQSSFESYREALATLDTVQLDPSYAGNVCNNLGNLYWYSEDYEGALEYYLRAYDYHVKGNREDQLIWTYINLANSYSQLNRHDSIILGYFAKAEEIAFRFEDPRAVGLIYLNTGSFHESRGQYKEAIKWLDRVRGEKYDQLIPSSKAAVWQTTSTAYLGLNEIEMARYFAEKANMVPQANNLNILKQQQFLLFQIDSASGNFKDAMYHLRNHKDILDSIHKRDIADKMVKLRMATQAKEKELEIQRLEYERQLALNNASNMRLVRNLALGLAALTLLVLFVALRLYKVRKRSILELSTANKELTTKNHLLGQREQELEEVNNSREKMYSIIAHDLKNPLNAMLGMTELLDIKYESLTKDKRKSFARIIHDASLRMSNLLENLLDWTRLQTGKIEFNPESILLNPIVEESLSLMETMAFEKNLRLVNKIDEKSVVYADRYMIAAILNNLITNAIKYSYEGGQVELCSSYNNGFECIQVIDKGIGMDEDYIVHLFNEDLIESRKGTRNEKGTGLGLHLCREFVTKHGGKIHVESQPDKGAKFWFTIPIDKPFKSEK